MGALATTGLLLTMLLSIASAAEPSPAARAEVDHLLAYLGTSGCQFYRNGTWYPAADARVHLEKKFAYLQKKGLVATAEDFVARGASESSSSGKPYQVRCGDAAPVPSAQWLGAELTRHREGSSSSGP